MNITLVAGPPGIGKTTWINQFLSTSKQPLFYLCPAAGTEAVDRLRVGYHFPEVTVVEDTQAAALLMNLPDQAQIYIELGFHLDLAALPFNQLPCRKVAIVPPELAQLTEQSEWHDWADELVAGNKIQVPHPNCFPETRRMPLTGQVFDPPSLDELLTEITGGAYGQVIRLKGIFEMPDGQAFDIDFVEGLPGIEYTELKLPRSLKGRPTRPSSLEVVGYDFQQKTMAEALGVSCLSDELIAQYQRQYRQQYKTTDLTNNAEENVA
ncbi:GTP-binding protein [cf. Phormidesmis sp. LEGE 11477]|uniref:GTP-binding protein n=1 Tax=cf. Phormidesmis sp. LEGE 11477 TaxID=1828680 RepID=UPI00187FE8A6|nr:GTP-binding protein [cf. Phormidesmis sp. LEGE 11477]MBE9062613.1 GTP-binding protein [cf. Phormidesmis sp. LEGE 11477]